MPRVSGSAWPWLLADDSDAIVGIRSGNVDQLFVFSNDDALNIDMSNLAATWNASGTTFTAVKMNVTDTASAAGSLLLNLQVGSASQFSVTKAGKALAGDGLAYSFSAAPNTGIGRAANDLVLYSGSTPTARLFGEGFAVASSNSIGFASGAVNSTTADTTLFRDAADTLALRRTTNAQTHRWYRSFTDASNYSRVYLGWSSSTAIVATEGAGTGARGNIAFGTAALETSATVGYVMIPSCAGAPTGVPADIPTGQVALHYDSTNHKLYVYSGAWRSTAALT